MLIVGKEKEKKKKAKKTKKSFLLLDTAGYIPFILPLTFTVTLIFIVICGNCFKGRIAKKGIKDASSLHVQKKGYLVIGFRETFRYEVHSLSEAVPKHIMSVTDLMTLCQINQGQRFFGVCLFVFCISPVHPQKIWETKSFILSDYTIYMYVYI